MIGPKRLVDLSSPNNPPLDGDRSYVWKLAWTAVSAMIFEHGIHLGYRLKASLLRLFGAKIGQRCLIKPRVRIKYPWQLEVGDDVWIGESVWIDNLARVCVGDSVCISQGALIITGNHDYSKKTFDRFCCPIDIKNCAWIGAMSIVCPGATVEQGAVLSVGSVLSGQADSWYVYRGNPAVKGRARMITGEAG